MTDKIDIINIGHQSHAKKVILGILELFVSLVGSLSIAGEQPWIWVEREVSSNFPPKNRRQIMPKRNRRLISKQSHQLRVNFRVNNMAKQTKKSLEVPSGSARPRQRSPQRWYANKNALWRQVRKYFGGTDIEQRYSYAAQMAAERWYEHTDDQWKAAGDLLRHQGGQVNLRLASWRHR